MRTSRRAALTALVVLGTWAWSSTARAADDPIRVVMLLRGSQVMPAARAAFEMKYGTGKLDLVITTDEADASVLLGARAGCNTGAPTH
jgi:hypothetical protein